MKRPLHTTLAAAALAITASPALATPTLHFSGALLSGASGVDVNGVAYDVSFQHGACETVFGTTACTPPGGFTFSTLSDATSASQALQGQVLIDPYPLSGCNVGSTCSILTPFAASGTTPNVVYHISLARTDGGVTSGTYNPAAFLNSQFTDAVWTPVPEPASAALLLPAAAGLLATRRRKRPA